MSDANESLLTWPAKIWLQREDENEIYVKACGMTWCEDAIGEADITYVREDLARGSRRMTDDYDVHEAGVEEGLSEAAAQIAILKAQLEEAREWIHALRGRLITFADPEHQRDILDGTWKFLAKTKAQNDSN